VDDTVTGWDVEFFNGDHVPGHADGLTLGCNDQPVVGTRGEGLDVVPLRQGGAVLGRIHDVNVDKLFQAFLILVTVSEKTLQSSRGKLAEGLVRWSKNSARFSFILKVANNATDIDFE
jgi:hypothetical protein